jgi:hypothetical protein
MIASSRQILSYHTLLYDDSQKINDQNISKRKFVLSDICQLSRELTSELTSKLTS